MIMIIIIENVHIVRHKYYLQKRELRSKIPTRYIPVFNCLKWNSTLLLADANFLSDHIAEFGGSFGPATKAVSIASSDSWLSLSLIYFTSFISHSIDHFFLMAGILIIYHSPVWPVKVKILKVTL